MSRVYPGGPIAFWALTRSWPLAPNGRAGVRARLQARRCVVQCRRQQGTLIKLVADYTKISPDIVARMSPVPAHAEIEPAGLARLTTMMKQSGLLTTDVDLRTKIFT